MQLYPTAGAANPAASIPLTRVATPELIHEELGSIAALTPPRSVHILDQEQGTYGQYFEKLVEALHAAQKTSPAALAVAIASRLGISLSGVRSMGVYSDTLFIEAKDELPILASYRQEIDPDDADYYMEDEPEVYDHIPLTSEELLTIVGHQWAGSERLQEVLSNSALPLWALLPNHHGHAVSPFVYSGVHRSAQAKVAAAKRKVERAETSAAAAGKREERLASAKSLLQELSTVTGSAALRAVLATPLKQAAANVAKAERAIISAEKTVAALPASRKLLDEAEAKFAEVAASEAIAIAEATRRGLASVHPARHTATRTKAAREWVKEHPTVLTSRWITLWR
jgi:hypothetical protein